MWAALKWVQYLKDLKTKLTTSSFLLDANTQEFSQVFYFLKLRAPLPSITHSTCVGLLIIMGPCNCEFIFLVISQISNPMNVSWRGFFFSNCCVWGTQGEATLRIFNILRKNHKLLYSLHFHFPASRRFFITHVTYLFLNKGSIETCTREGWAENVRGISSRGWESQRLLTGSFPAHWHQHKGKQHIHFVQFALPSHMELVHVKGC